MIRGFEQAFAIKVKRTLANLKTSVPLPFLHTYLYRGRVLTDEDKVLTSPPQILLEVRPHLMGGMKRGWLVSSDEDKTPSATHQVRRWERSDREGQEVSVALRAMTSMASSVATLVERMAPAPPPPSAHPTMVHREKPQRGHRVGQMYTLIATSVGRQVEFLDPKRSDEKDWGPLHFFWGERSTYRETNCESEHTQERGPSPSRPSNLPTTDEPTVTRAPPLPNGDRPGKGLWMSGSMDSHPTTLFPTGREHETTSQHRTNHPPHHERVPSVQTEYHSQHTAPQPHHTQHPHASYTYAYADVYLTGCGPNNTNPCYPTPAPSPFTLHAPSTIAAKLRCGVLPPDPVAPSSLDYSSANGSHWLLAGQAKQPPPPLRCCHPIFRPSVTPMDSWSPPRGVHMLTATRRHSNTNGHDALTAMMREQSRHRCRASTPAEQPGPWESLVSEGS